MDLAEVADELYALPPAEFTASRNDRAKAIATGDKALADRIRRLPKPSVSAWAVNMLVRRRPADIAGILDLGASLREAQDALNPHELKALGQQRRALIAAVARLGRDLARELGNPISESAASELEQTLQAAMADPEAGLAVRSGRLVRALTSTGLEPTDLSGAVAVPSALPESPSAREAGPHSPAGPIHARRRSGSELEIAQQALDAAELRANKTQSELQRIEQRISALTTHREQLTDALDELQARIADVTRDIAAVAHETRALTRDRDGASRASGLAKRNLAKAREALSRDARGSPDHR